MTSSTRAANEYAEIVRRARESAGAMGHGPGRFRAVAPSDWVASCKSCGKTLEIYRMSDGGYRLGGSALTGAPCPGKGVAK
jgi:hypothetical protein